MLYDVPLSKISINQVPVGFVSRIEPEYHNNIFLPDSISSRSHNITEFFYRGYDSSSSPTKEKIYLLHDEDDLTDYFLLITKLVKETPYYSYLETLISINTWKI